MTATFALTDGTTTLDLLEPTDHVTRYSGIRTPPPPQEIVYSGSRQRAGTLPASSHYGNREITVNLLVEGTTIDDLLQNYSDAAKMLAETTLYDISGGREGKQARLQVKIDGATNTIEYTVRAGQIDPGDWATVSTMTQKHLDDVTITLTCSPFAQETSDTTVTAAAILANGDSVTITSPRGEVPTPVKITLKNTVPISITDMIYVALRSYGTPANFLFQLRGETGVHTGHTVTDLSGAEPSPTAYAEVAAVGTTSNDAYGRWTAGAASGGFLGGSPFRLERWAITANLTDHYGRFRVIGRLSAEGSEDRTLYLYYGTKNTPTNITKATEGGKVVALTTSWKLVDLGIISWPDVKVPPGVAVSTLTLELSAASAANNDELRCDGLILLPVDEGCLFLGGCTEQTANDFIVIDGQSDPPAIYVTDSSGNLKGAETVSITTRNGPFLNLPPRTSRIFVICENTVATVYSNTVDFALSYRPRYTQWRGS